MAKKRGGSIQTEPTEEKTGCPICSYYEFETCDHDERDKDNFLQDEKYEALFEEAQETQEIENFFYNGSE